MDIKCIHCGSYNNIREVVTRCLECNNNLFNQKTENMNNVFKKGDRVFVAPYSWCEFETYLTGSNAWCFVNQGSKTLTVRIDMVSFTEYRLEGFTQERPFQPEIGKFYWFWDDFHKENNICVYGLLTAIKENADCKYKAGRTASYFKHISDKKPLE